MPHLVEVHRELADDGLVILALSNEDVATVRGVVQRQGLPFGVGAGSGSFSDYGVRGIPQSFLIDRDGRIVWKGHPADPGWLQKARALL